MQQAPEAMTLKVIAHIHTAFPTKFGIPRQSGLVEELRGEIVFTPEYRNPDALRGLEDFSRLSGWCGSFPAQCGTAGPPPSGRPASAATPGWAYLPPARPSGPIRWGCPASSWKPSSTGLTSAPSSSCGALT